MNFDKAIEILLDEEKGYVFHPDDPGGETNFGITKRVYPDLNIKTLTREDAVDIYYRDYWDKLSLHLLPPGLNLMVFDCAVNQGQPTAIQFLKSASIACDAIDIESMITFISNAREDKYFKHPKYQVFGKGWSKRLRKISLICAFSSAGDK